MKDSISNRLKQLMSEQSLKQVDILNKTLPLQTRHNVRLAKNDLSQYVNGKVEPNQERIFILSKALGVSEAWLMGFDVPRERIDKEDKVNDLISIYQKLGNDRKDKVYNFAEYQFKEQTSAEKSPQLFKIEANEALAAGVGFAYEGTGNTEAYYTDRSDLKDYSFATRVQGDSMATLINDGDLVLIKQGYDHQKGGIYAIDYDGKSYLKRVYFEDNHLVMKSENEKYEDIVVDLPVAEDVYLNIIGKVVDWFKPATAY